MKSILISSVTAAIAALTLTTAAFAQYKPVGDDGIAASPKLRQLLNDKLSTTKPGPTMAGPTMSCKKCADVPSAELRPEAKGAEVISQARRVSFSHSCSSCRTELSTA